MALVCLFLFFLFFFAFFSTVSYCGSDVFTKTAFHHIGMFRFIFIPKPSWLQNVNGFGGAKNQREGLSFDDEYFGSLLLSTV